MNVFKKIILPNGLRVILVPQPQSLAASVLILVRAGSEYETKRRNGLSHFLEHMMFKGTAKRPRVGQTAEELDALGAHYNAFTGQEYTGYYAKAEAKKLSEIIDIVSDLYLNPLFNADEIEKERGVIVEEINMDVDRLPRKAAQIFNELLYGDQPAGWDIAGTKEILKKLGKRDLEAYRAERYVMSGTVVVVAGKFHEREVAGQIRRAFARLPKGRAPAKSQTVERQARPRARVFFKESGQSHLVLGFRSFNLFDKRRYAVQALADILGGSMSSRLFRKIREELGAAYYISADAALMLDHGTFEIAAGVEHGKLEAAVMAILAECRRVAENGIPEAELQRSKDHMVGNLIIGLETSDDLASFYGGQEILTGKPLIPEWVIGKIRDVKARDVQNVARDIFKNQGLNLAVVGPRRDTAGLQKLLKI